jgi:hypothetical protein
MTVSTGLTSQSATLSRVPPEGIASSVNAVSAMWFLFGANVEAYAWLLDDEGPASRKSPSVAKQKRTVLRLVPVERIELPTFGLQNRCSTAELNRRTECEVRAGTHRSAELAAGHLSDLTAKGQKLGDPPGGVDTE